MTINLAAEIPFYNYNIFGIGTTSTKDVKRSNELLQKFFASSGYTQADLTTTDTTQQAAILEKYAQFLAVELSNAYQIESLVELSPEEMMRRNILFETFNVVLKMLKALQDCLRSASNALVLLTKWQDQYTSMMTKIPLYAPGASERIIFNAQDVGQSTFGYANIKLEDITKYLFDQLYKTRTNVFFDNQDFRIRASINTTTKVIAIDFAVRGPPDLNLFSSAQIPYSETAPDFRSLVAPAMQSLTANYNAASGPVPPPAIVTYETVKAMLQDGLFTGTPWNSITQVLPGTDDTSKDTNKVRAGNRGELNGKLQLMLENARSLRQQVRDMSKPVENLVSQTREAIQGQSQLLSAVTEMMKGLIGAIFR